MKKLLVILILCLSAGILRAQTLDEAPAAKDLQVNQIYLEGVKKFLPFEIKAQMKLKERKLWAKNSYFDAEVLQSDLDRIVIFYEDSGFYDTLITPTFKLLPKKKMNISLNIQEGYYFKISKIDILNDGGISPEVKKLLYKNLKINENGIFSYKNYDDSKKVILAILADHGYYEASLTGRVLMDRVQRSAKVEYTLQSGPMQKFGLIKVTGTRNVREGLITRELTFNGKEIFNASKLNESQRRIFDLGFFKSVSLQPVPRPDDPSILDINLQVEERPFYNLKIGPGYGAEDRERIQAFWKLLNFGRLGGNLEINGKLAVMQHLLTVNFTQPYFSDRFTSLITSVGYEKDFYNYYRQEKVTGLSRILRSLTPKLNVFFGYQVERDLIFITDPAVSYNVDTGFAHRYILSSFNTGFQHKTTEDIFNPKQGQIDSFTWEFTPKYLGSSVSFLRGIWEYKYFYPVNDYLVLAWRNQFGYARTIFDSPSLPIFKRFFSGGSYSVRGYSYQELGPHDASDNPMGGNSQWEGNLEMRFPLYRDFGAVLFYDYGEVYADTKQYTINGLLTTAGLGLRYNTPIGPIRLDYGYKLKPYQGTSRYKIYVNIGQAF